MSDTASGAVGGASQGGNAPSHVGGGAAAGSETSPGGAIREQAARAVDEGKGKFKEQADDLLGAARQRVRRLATEQKEFAAARLGSVAHGLRQAADDMGQQSEFAGRYARTAAERLERLSTDLRDADLEDLIDRTEDYARRNPALFLGGAVAAGFLFARFIKSSGRRATNGGRFERPSQDYGVAQADL